MKDILPVLLLVVLLALLPGCTPVRPYWTEKGDPRVVKKPCLESPETFRRKLEVLEIDEEGDVWSSYQWDEASRMISKSEKTPLVFVYVHGWKHDARPDDSDLLGFNRFLDHMQKFIRNREVQGIYVGWRGEATDLPVLKEFTFWGRRSATDRVGGIPLASALWKIKQATKKRSSEGKVILIGHSFGGRTIERCVGPALLASHAGSGNIERSIQRDPTASLPADMIILVNPASEALYCRQLKLALGGWPEDSPPGIVSLTAANDNGTGWWWRIGSNLGLFFRRPLPADHREYPLGHRNHPDPADWNWESQRENLVRTSGHKDTLIDHSTWMDLEQSGGSGHSIEMVIARNLKNDGDTDRFLVRTRDGSAFYKLRKNLSGMHKIPSNGYWVIQADQQSILDGHVGSAKDHGIFSDGMISVFTGIYGKTRPDARNFTQPEQEKPPVEIFGEQVKAPNEAEPAAGQGVSRVTIPTSISSRD